jgi:phosphopantothenoylcysteine decarboxylase/phosphopantothenate--cysteine ligase
MDRQQSRTDCSLLFCITGSIAAPAVLPVLQLFIERAVFKTVRVAISETALRFVRPEPFAVLSGGRCIVDLFDDAWYGSATHVRLAAECDIALVAPASANTMSKLAHGIAEGTVPTILSVFEGPKILVPAAHPTTQKQASFIRNQKQLQKDGYLFCGPVLGYSISENRRGPDVLGIPPADAIAAYVEHVATFGEPP